MKDSIFSAAAALLLCVLTVSNVRASEEPSFDCERASTDIEKAICANPALAARDAQLARLYMAFLDNLPEASRPNAREMQRLWLRNRMVRCSQMKRSFLDGMYSDERREFGPPPASGAWPLENLTFELPALPATDLSDCLVGYYDFAIDSLQKGVLTSDVYLVDGVTHYPIGVENIESIYMETKTQNDPQVYDTLKDQEIWLSTGSAALLLEEVHDESYNGQTVLGIRLIMSGSGASAAAVKTLTYSRGGRCGNQDSLYLRFFKLAGDELQLFSGNKGSTVPLVNANYTCFPYTDKALEWHTKGDTLVYTYRKENVAAFMVLLPSMEEYVVNLATASVGVRPYIDTDTAAYRGETYEALWANFSEKFGTVKFPDNTSCTVTSRLLTRYLDLKIFAAEKNISVPQAFFILEKVWIPGRFNEAVQEYAPAARVFLDYLARARSVESWQEKLAQIAREFPYRNHHGFAMGDFPERGVVAQAGFPTDGACFASSWSLAAGMGLEDWIYLFWYRRASDGHLNEVEALLQKAVDLDRQLRGS